MKVISTGSKFDIYPDDLKSYDLLPADYYVVRFHPKKGFYLEKYSEFQMTESKIYKMLVTQALDERDLLVKKIQDKIEKASNR